MKPPLKDSGPFWPACTDTSPADALHGLRVLDLSQNAPGPLASMLLADFGADVIHVAAPNERVASSGYLKTVAEDPMMGTRFSEHDAVMRNKRSMRLDLKSTEHATVCRRLALAADVFIEEMRPGKAAKLGLAYEDLRRDNPRLVYASITGYGQYGPRAADPGHDINYIAASGVLDLLRDGDGCPHVPLNVAADYGGGGMMAAFAILVALQARERLGHGQWIDLAMTDGTTYLALDLLSPVLGGRRAPSEWRGTLGGDAPFYGIYRCVDGTYLAVGALERRFAAELCGVLGRPDLMHAFEDRTRWPAARAAMNDIFATRSRDEWLKLMPPEACVTAVIESEQLCRDPQAVARKRVVDFEGMRQVGIAPKLSATPGRIRRRPRSPGADTEEIFRAGAMAR